MQRPPEVTKTLNHITAARREIIKAVERYAKIDDQVGLLPGHRVEAARRMRAVKVEVDRLCAELGMEAK